MFHLWTVLKEKFTNSITLTNNHMLVCVCACVCVCVCVFSYQSLEVDRNTSALITFTSLTRSPCPLYSCTHRLLSSSHNPMIWSAPPKNRNTWIRNVSTHQNPTWIKQCCMWYNYYLKYRDSQKLHVNLFLLFWQVKVMQRILTQKPYIVW